MALDEVVANSPWKDWVRRHLQGGVSVSRLQRRMREAGVDPRTANRIIAVVAQEKHRCFCRSASLRIGTGALLLLIPIPLAVTVLLTDWIPSVRALVVLGATTLVGLGFVGQGLRWRRRAAVLADPLGTSETIRRTPGSPAAPMLEGELLQTRLKHLNSMDLAAIQDVLHAFFRCSSCGRRISKIVILGGNLFDILNDPARLSSVLTVEPERFIPDLGSEKCDGPHATPLTLTHGILCRTNPRSRNDLHLIVHYEADGMASPLRVAVLEKSGAYSLLSEEESLKLLGFPTHASRH